MGNETFSVGEIAVWIREGSPFWGERVRVCSPLWQSSHADGRTGIARLTWVHTIEWLDSDHGAPRYGSCWAAEPFNLRKLPPKQDWDRLCNLTDTPREVEHV